MHRCAPAGQACIDGTRRIQGQRITFSHTMRNPAWINCLRSGMRSCMSGGVTFRPRSLTPSYIPFDYWSALHHSHVSGWCDSFTSASNVRRIISLMNFTQLTWKLQCGRVCIVMSGEIVTEVRKVFTWYHPYLSTIARAKKICTVPPANTCGW